MTKPRNGEPHPDMPMRRWCEICDDYDMGGSHYHCAKCGGVTGMYGHYIGKPGEDGHFYCEEPEVAAAVFWGRFRACPRCRVPIGKPCIDLRYRTTKTNARPHRGRPYLIGGSKWRN